MKRYVAVACLLPEPPFHQFTWGVLSDAGLSIALAGEIRVEVEAAIRVMLDRGVTEQTTDHAHVSLHASLPKGTRLTRWPKDVPIPESSVY